MQTIDTVENRREYNLKVKRMLAAFSLLMSLEFHIITY